MNRGRRPAGAGPVGVLVVVLAGAAALPVAARPNVTGQTVVRVGTGYQSNPFLLPGPRDPTPFVSTELLPSLRVTEARSEASFDGALRRLDYRSRVGENNEGSASVFARYDLTERARLRISAGYETLVVGTGNVFGSNRGGLGSVFDQPVVAAPGNLLDGGTGLGGFGIPGIDFIGTDLDLIGRGQRRNRLSSGLTVESRPNAREAWEATLSGARTSFPNTQFADDFRDYGVNGRYRRQLSERATVAVGFSAGRLDYDRVGKASSFSPELSGTYRLSEAWVTDASVGVIRYRAPRLFGGIGRSSELTIRGRLCRQDDRTTSCLQGGRTVAGTGLGRVGAQSFVQLSTVARLNARDSFSAYTRYSQLGSDPLRGLGKRKAWNGSVLYTKGFTDRLSLVTAAEYRDIRIPDLAIRPDIAGRIGLSIAIGRLDYGRD